MDNNSKTNSNIKNLETEIINIKSKFKNLDNKIDENSRRNSIDSQNSIELSNLKIQLKNIGNKLNEIEKKNSNDLLLPNINNIEENFFQLKQK